eukprot:CAMPEP_0169282866 /NCGR_PEP_ID=MMETSP1016-20121227/57194_1 /TAXON_ID=342587 /ORGANISM="Karlodinium micrum, Strain CCMP2283" /LENGTH=168 /DNA_ID=CAMNT_0009371937 /DNA_START=28 /DNA_END=530 /DNA_ORIENTATION=+
MPKIPPSAKHRARPSGHFDAFGGGKGAYVFVPDGEFDAHVLGQAGPLPPHGPPPPGARAYKGGHKGLSPWGPPQMKGAPMVPVAPAPVNMEKIYERAHDAIFHAVGEAVAEKVTRYMAKASRNPELMSLPWEEFCAELVKGMFHGYSASCGEAPWFFQIDLAPALSAA